MNQTNYEKYAAVLVNAIVRSMGVSKDGNPIDCSQPGSCKRCMFDGQRCVESMHEWLFDEAE